MSPEPSLAIDVALLVAEPVASLACELNALVAGGGPGGLRFDATHLPHVTLVQQFVPRDNLGDVVREVAAVAAGTGPLALRIERLAEQGTVMLALSRTDALQRLHETLMDALEPYDAGEGSEAAFFEDGEPARERDIAWVSSYRRRSAYAHYVPHITVGHGEARRPVENLAFTARRLAVCHLGRFCTCRVILSEHKLDGNP